MAKNNYSFKKTKRVKGTERELKDIYHFLR